MEHQGERIARNFRVRVNGSEPGAVATGYKGAIDGSEEPNGNGENGFALTEENREELTRVVEECTTSITREVAGLKALVDEFSRFARMPTPRKEPGDLNETLRSTQKAVPPDGLF